MKPQQVILIGKIKADRDVQKWKPIYNVLGLIYILALNRN